MARIQEPDTIDFSNSSAREDRPPLLTSFPATNDDYRYLQKRASILCAAFNAQPHDVSDADRARAWNDIVNFNDLTDYTSEPNNAAPPPWPMIKGPIYIDYAINVQIHPSCFVDRDCYIADTPESEVRIGENTIVGGGVRILGVTHPIDWRERQGRYGPSLAGDVRIGRECLVGAGVVILPGVTIGECCVIGAGSVVTKSIPAFHVAAGNPARVIRKVANDVPDAPGLAYDAETGRVPPYCSTTCCRLPYRGDEPSDREEQVGWSLRWMNPSATRFTPGQAFVRDVLWLAFSLLTSLAVIEIVLRTMGVGVRDSRHTGRPARWA